MAVTPSLGLHQWGKDDSFLRTDFNEDFSKLDTAIGGQLKAIEGSFTGNGVYPRKITLPGKPKLVLIDGYRNRGTQSSPTYERTCCICTDFLCLSLTDSPGISFSGSPIKLYADGFRVEENNYFNISGFTSSYLCLL